MIKKLINIVLGVVLLLSSVGVDFSRHYCGDKLVEAKIFSQLEACCKKAAGFSKECCHIENDYFQLAENSIPEPSLNIFVKLDYSVVQLQNLGISAFAVESLSFTRCRKQQYSPPDLNILLQVFRI